MRAPTGRTLSALHFAVYLPSSGVASSCRIAPEELPYLDTVCQQVVADELSPADILLRNWHGSWHASMPYLFEYLRIA